MTDRPYRGAYQREEFNQFIGDGRGRMNEVLALPNVRDVDHLFFLSNISAGGHGLEFAWGWCRAEPDHQAQWTALFLHVREGAGYAVIYPKRTLTFAICEHEKVSTPSSSRTYKPGYCGKCGIDMTVDSGD